MSVFSDLDETANDLFFRAYEIACLQTQRHERDCECKACETKRALAPI